MGASTKRVFLTFAALLCGSATAGGQGLSPKWEELTAEDFVTALARSANTCLLPFGIIEKHGPSGL
jgi:creatinine amidohydrolase